MSKFIRLELQSPTLESDVTDNMHVAYIVQHRIGLVVLLETGSD